MRIILIALSIMIMGCATVGTKIESDKLSQIKEGVTTKQQVVSLIGKPSTVSLSPDGKEIFTYQYAHASNRASNFIPVVGLFTGGIDTKQETTQILIDKNNVVEKIVYNDSNIAMNTGLLNQK